MAINKGLLSLVENTPNFSNQTLINAVDPLKIGWVLKGSQLDSSIDSNTVLTVSQKNDLKDTINNQPQINVGKTLEELVRHSAKIIDGSIIPGDPNILTGDQGQGSFIEILQTVQGLQTLIPELYGVSASAKSRGVNDHLGTLNNIFVKTTDGVASGVFASLIGSIKFIVDANLAQETALETAYDNLKDFVNSVVADSTDFQQTLDTFGNAVATAHTNFNTALASEPYLTHRNNISKMCEKINVQVSLENSNITSIRTYIETLSNTLAYTSLAADDTLRELMSVVAQDSNWQAYFNEYEVNSKNNNALYHNPSSDSSISEIVDSVMKLRGLPDVIDYTDVNSVSKKALKDVRIKDKISDAGKSAEQIIDDSLNTLGLSTAGSVYAKSKTLLRNMNDNDVEIIKKEIALFQDVDTLS